MAAVFEWVVGAPIVAAAVEDEETVRVVVKDEPEPVASEAALEWSEAADGEGEEGEEGEEVVLPSGDDEEPVEEVGEDVDATEGGAGEFAEGLEGALP